MMNMHSASGRTALGFSIHGLSSRDETLFKSYLRLLDHRTEQQWLHQQDHADVRIVADGCPLTGEPATAASRWQLTIGTTAREVRHFICLPFKADQLESELNLLGALVMMSVRGTSPAASHGASTQHDEEAVRLVRWPTPSLLNTPERLRLATLMTGRSFLPSEMVGRYGGACMGLITELRRAGLLVPVSASATLPVRPRQEARTLVQPGLLARIRSRLGISQHLSLS